ncbi:hypothetical protein NC651_014752 [Populus alba x Populus x berolinensis]|nr:hypothetical protein NC651_014752 [Populus alba x Populus x berolinensis]
MKQTSNYTLRELCFAGKLYILFFFVIFSPLWLFWFLGFLVFNSLYLIRWVIHVFLFVFTGFVSLHGCKFYVNPFLFLASILLESGLCFLPCFCLC